MKIKQFIILTAFFIALGCGISVEAQSFTKQLAFPQALLSHSCAPWDGAAVELLLNNDKTFPYIRFDFYDKLENFQKDNVKNLKYKFVGYDNNHSVSAFYCQTQNKCESPASAEIIFESLSIKGISSGRYTIKLKNSIIEGTFNTPHWAKQEMQMCG